MKPSRLAGSGELGVRPVVTLGVPKSPENGLLDEVDKESANYLQMTHLLNDLCDMLDEIGETQQKELMLFNALNRWRQGGPSNDGASIRSDARIFVETILGSRL